MKYGFIARHRSVWPTRTMCRVMAVSHSGFYEWLGRAPSQRSQDDARLTRLIRESFELSDRTYGSPRVWHDLRALGESCGMNRVIRLMHLAKLQARHKRRRLPSDTGSRLENHIAPNYLQRDFEASGPNQKWVADFTYICTAEGWLYAAAVMDLYSRRIVGWSMSDTMQAKMVSDALLMALWRRGKPRSLMHHSDQGSPVHQRRLPAAAQGTGHHLQHEPSWGVLGQRRDGELLLIHEDRTAQPQGLPDKGRSQVRRVRLHRALLQPGAQTLKARLPQPSRL